jgi:hypothetical protein
MHAVRGFRNPHDRYRVQERFLPVTRRPGKEKPELKGYKETVSQHISLHQKIPADNHHLSSGMLQYIMERIQTRKI